MSVKSLPLPESTRGPLAEVPGSPSQSLAPALLAEIVRRIVEVAHPERIILFGSAARGGLGPDRDIDLLVVKADVADRGRLAEEIHLRFFGLPVSVDVLVVTPEDIELCRDTVGTVIGPALREGREVYAAR